MSVNGGIIESVKGGIIVPVNGGIIVNQSREGS